MRLVLPKSGSRGRTGTHGQLSPCPRPFLLSHAFFLSPPHCSSPHWTSFRPRCLQYLDLCYNIFQDHREGLVILCLWTCFVKSKIPGYVHACNGRNRILNAVSIDPWVRCAHFPNYHGADALDRGLAEALLCLSMGLRQANLLRRGGKSPWNVCQGKGSQGMLPPHKSHEQD